MHCTALRTEKEKRLALSHRNEELAQQTHSSLADDAQLARDIDDGTTRRCATWDIPVYRLLLHHYPELRT